MQHLEREQALAKQFAEILHFTLSFDELKVRGSADEAGEIQFFLWIERLNKALLSFDGQMTNPAIQNDFSYYRRTISRNRLNNQQVRPR